MTTTPAPQKKAVFTEIGLLFLATTLVLSVLYRFRSVPFVEGNLAVVAALAFLYLPAFLLWRRGQQLEDFGFHTRPLLKNLALWLACSVVVLLPFALAYDYFVNHFCGDFLRRWVVCPTPFSRSLRLPPKLPLVLLSQLLVVALPEEFFFRGFAQQRFAEIMSWRQALLCQALLFALGHFLVTFSPASLLVFFPGLVFGWLRQVSGSIFAGTLFHATCNLTMEVLRRSLG